MRSALSPAIALVLAARLGAWQEIPHAAWWVALGLAGLAFAVLVRRARELARHRSGLWRNTGRALSTALEVMVLVLLFS